MKTIPSRRFPQKACCKAKAPQLHRSSVMQSGPALASAGPDWKHFCGAPLRGVCRNFRGGASSLNDRNHEWCERAKAIGVMSS